MRRSKVLLIVGVIVGLTAVTAVSLGAIDEPSQTDNASFQTPEGLEVSVAFASSGNFSYPFPNKYAFRLKNNSVGNITVQSVGNSEVTIEQPEGEHTNLSDVKGGLNPVTVLPVGLKNDLSIESNWTQINYTNVVLDDNESDISYECSNNPCTVRIYDLPTNKSMRFETESGNKIITDDQTDFFGTGLFNFNDSYTLFAREGSASDNDNTTAGGNDSAPLLTNPQPIGPQSDPATELSVNVNDSDFQDAGAETVNVSFYLNGTFVGNQTLQTPGQANVSVSPGIGQHAAKAVAEDLQNNSAELRWNFGGSGFVFIRNRTAPYDFIGNRNASLRFFFNNGSDKVIETFANSTVAGPAKTGFNLTGLPDDKNILLDVQVLNPDPNNLSDYHLATYVLRNITGNRTLYALEKGTATKQVEFGLDDRTGRFENNNATLTVQKAINLSSDSNPRWRTIHEEYFKIGDTTVNLTQGERYRLTVRNSDGERRIVGTYTPSRSEFVPLVLTDTLQGVSPDELGYRYNASYINDSQGERIEYYYADPDENTQIVYVTVHEFGDESNTLLNNASYSFTGNRDDLQGTVFVPSSQNATSWAVDFYVLRDNEWSQQTRIVGPASPALTGLSPWLAALISLGSIWMVAGLFSQLNGDIGGLAVAGLGAFFWWVDFLPAPVGFGVVALALVTAGLLFINERRGGFGA